jgi:hypothetical protein
MPTTLPNTKNSNPERSEESSSQSSPRKSYEPPRIERLGNLRELLAKTGPAPDAPGPHPVRT